MRLCPSRYVVALLFYCFLSKIWGTKIDGEHRQVSSLIEIHYAIGAMGGASSSTPPRITDKDIVSSPIESSETLFSLSDAALESSVSSFEVVKRSRGSAGSSHSSFTLIEADSETLEPESESLASSATPVPTEEEEFLANMCGDTDEFGVSLRCIYPRFTPVYRSPSSADITNPTSSSARQIVKPLGGLQERQRQWRVDRK
jgi:hypothetical protein